MDKCKTRMSGVGILLLRRAPAATMAETDAPPTYTGDLWSRPRLSGYWFGGRDWLAKRGVTFDLDMTQVLQSVNWPAPDGTFSLYMRAYRPDNAILDGK